MAENPDWLKNYTSRPPNVPTSLPQQKAQADIVQSGASAESSKATAEETRAMLPGKLRKQQIEERTAERQAALPILTPGQQKADEEFAKMWTAWRAGDIATYNRNLDQLQDAINILQRSDTISGPVIGKLPESIQKLIDPESGSVRSQIYNAINATLRQTLGAQFTAEEGARIMKQAFDPEAEESVNLKKVRSLIEELKDRGAAMESMARYWEAPNEAGMPRQTLSGYNPATSGYAEIRKQFVTSEPKPGERWMTPDQEKVFGEYANDPNFTAKGYADLLQRFADENKRTLDYDSNLRIGEQMEEYRRSGKTYGPGVDYIKPSEPATAPKATATEVEASPPAPGNGLSFGQVLKSGVSAALGPIGLIPNKSLARAVQSFPSDLFNLVKTTATGMGEAAATPSVMPSVGGIPGSLSEKFSQLGMSALGAAGITNADPTMAQAVGKVYADRYGSLEKAQRTFEEHPAEFLADVSSVLSLGGGAIAKGGQLARIPSVVRTGKVMETGARLTDPFNIALGGGEAAATLARKYIPEGVRETGSRVLTNLTQKYPAAVVAVPSGVGGETLQEAFGAGRQRSRQGPNLRSATFTEQMRGTASAEDVVRQLEAGISRMGENLSSKYETDILPISQDATQLDFTPVQDRVAKMRPRTLGIYKKTEPTSAELAWTKVNDLVQEHADLIASDPARFATPKALDDFKQRLYDVAFETGSPRIAKQAYGAIKDVIAKQAPAYTKVMSDYSKGKDMLSQINRTLASGGRYLNIDSTVRRLQSIMRRTDTGYAGELVGKVSEQPGVELQAAVAGRSGQPITPDRLRTAIAGGTTLSALGGQMPFEFVQQIPTADPLMTAITLALMSPRAVTETAYGMGRGLGLAERGAKGVYGAYEGAPGTTLGAANVLNVMQQEQAAEEEERKRMELLRRYNLSLEVPGMPIQYGSR